LFKVNLNKLKQLVKAIRIHYTQVIRPALSLQSLLIMLPAGLVARQRYVAECSSGLYSSGGNGGKYMLPFGSSSLQHKSPEKFVQMNCVNKSHYSCGI